jgi:hypothetical protein
LRGIILEWGSELRRWNFFFLWQLRKLHGSTCTALRVCYRWKERLTFFMWSRITFRSIGVLWANEHAVAKLRFMAASMSKPAWKMYKAISLGIDTLGLAPKRHEILAQDALMDFSFNCSNARRSLQTEEKWDQ